MATNGQFPQYPTGELRKIIKWFRQNYPMRCFYCGVALMGKKGLLKYPHLSLKTEDHVIARSKNGGNSGVNKALAVNLAILPSVLIA